jgi:molecular chaperone GrpE
MKESKKYQEADREHVADAEGFSSAEGHSDCEEGTCANMADDGVCDGDTATKMTDEAARWKDLYMRLQAEFDNYRKRTLKEKMELVSSAGEGIIKALLPVLDDFDRALDAIGPVQDAGAVGKGVSLISQKFRDTLKQKGVSEIEAMGHPLDTDFHEAIAKVPAGENDRGHIVDVVQKGYKLNDKVIRHSKVVVGE